MKKNLPPAILYFVLVTLNCFGLQSQIAAKPSRTIDSLLTVLKTSKEDTTKVNTLLSLFLEYEFDDTEKANEYLSQAIELSKNANYKKGLADSHLYLGYFSEDKGNYQEALKFYFISLKYYLELGNKKGVADSHNNIGNIYDKQGNYPEAIKNYFTSLKIAKEIGDKNGEASSYNNIGLVYEHQGNYPQALKNHFSSLKIEEEAGDRKGKAISFNNIGLVYYHQRNYSEALKNYFASLNLRETLNDKIGIADSYNNIGLVYYNQNNYTEALKNYFASLKINNEIGDKAGISSVYNNFGNVYYDQGNYSEALKNHFSSLEIKEVLGDREGLASSYCNIGQVYIKLKKYREADEYLKKALVLSKEIGQKEILRDSYNSLTYLDSETGNFKGAYENHKLFILYGDSLDNEETRKKTIQSQMTYDFEKKEAVASVEHKKELENQEAIADEKSHKQKIILFFVLASLLLVLFFAGFVFRSLRETRKQKNIIVEQKGMVEKQKHLVEEKQKEIVDSITYAKRIQYTLLGNKQLLDSNLSFPIGGGAEGGGDYFVLFKPKDIVSGDFYWATKKVDNRQMSDGKEKITERFYIAVCDSTGHGVPGAFMSLLNISFLNEAVNEKNIVEPHEILNHVRKRLIENMDGGQDGMDCILLCFETSPLSERSPLSFGEGRGGRCTYAAANNSPCIIKNGVLISLPADKMPVGKGENEVPFTLHTIDLPSYSNLNKKTKNNVAKSSEPKVLSFGEDIGGASFLYLYTDGYADQFGGPKGKKFKYKQLDELFVSISKLPTNEQSEILNNRFEEWKGDLEQVDDMLVIGIRI